MNNLLGKMLIRLSTLVLAFSTSYIAAIYNNYLLLLLIPVILLFIMADYYREQAIANYNAFSKCTDIISKLSKTLSKVISNYNNE